MLMLRSSNRPTGLAVKPPPVECLPLTLPGTQCAPSPFFPACVSGTLCLHLAHRLPAAQVTDDNRTENVWAIDRDPANITPTFRALLALVGDPGACWVSNYCFPPAAFVQGANAMIAKLPTLTVYRDTVVKSVATASDGQGGLKIVSLTAIQRTPQPNVTCNGYDRFLSQVRSEAPCNCLKMQH